MPTCRQRATPAFRRATGRALSCAALLFVTACVAGPDYRPPSATELRIPATLPSAPAAAEPAWIERWWSRLDDPMLPALVDRSLDSNQDIAAAAARLRQAREQAAGEGAALLPTVTGSASSTRSFGQQAATSAGSGAPGATTGGGDRTTIDGRLAASWEIDLFGGTRRRIEAAGATAQAREANLREVRSRIAADVARAYVEARLAQARVEVNSRNLAALRESVRIARWRAQAGLVSSLDVEQAVQLEAQTAATIPALNSSYRTAINRLSLLGGDPPGTVDTGMATARPIPSAAAATPALVPLDIVRRRPDVAAAERSLAAETARIGVEAARLYPALSLTGSLGGTATSFLDLVDNLVGSLGAAIDHTLFDGGRTKASVRAQQAVRDAALADYRHAVLGALEDADNRYDALTAARERVADRIVSEDAARNAVLYQRIRYRAGLVAFTELLDAERTSLTAADARLQAEAEATLALVALFQALGGDDGRSNDA